MNGSVGRALTCAGMSAEMEMQLHAHWTQQHTMPTNDEHVDHHPPADQPAGPLKQLGVGLPTLSSGGSAKSGRRSTHEVVETLGDAGLTLAPGNAIAGYVYDDAAVEFTLCVESESGAWATYDTAPMTLRENGAAGGCPFG